MKLINFLNKSSSHGAKIWIERQKKDPYVKRAIKETYRARSAFKLIEINDKYRFINRGNCVVDIGASPGSWTQVAVNLTNSIKSQLDNDNGIVISVDRDYMMPVEGAHILCKHDIKASETFNEIEKLLLKLNRTRVDCILSDMVILTNHLINKSLFYSNNYFSRLQMRQECQRLITIQ
jgi:23S rRNA (uridine2552-2'-O)-methyltransferase